MFAPRVCRIVSVTSSQALIPRPEQIRAMSRGGAIMVAAAAALRRHYGGVSCPSIVMTGDADRVVDPEDQSIRLAHELNDAELRIVPADMVHRVPLEVAEAIDRVASGRGRLPGSGLMNEFDGAGFPIAAGILFGLGLGGFFDGIVLHQILQWHHMLTDAGYPATSASRT